MKKILILSFLFFLASTNIVLADSACLCNNGAKRIVSSCLNCSTACTSNGGMKSCTDGADDSSSNQVTLDNPLPSGTDPQSLIGNIISAVMGIIGSLALAMFIYGGFTWMTAAGNSERVSKGKDILIWATLGLIAIFASYSIIKFLIGSIG